MVAQKLWIKELCHSSPIARWNEKKRKGKAKGSGSHQVLVGKHEAIGWAWDTTIPYEYDQQHYFISCWYIRDVWTHVVEKTAFYTATCVRNLYKIDSNDLSISSHALMVDCCDNAQTDKWWICKLEDGVWVVEGVAE
jgi:hypothetical protein